MRPVRTSLVVAGTVGLAAVLWSHRELLASVEEPRHRVVREDGRFEIREYEPVVAAEVFVPAADRGQAANQAFRTLFAYISGANTGETEIPMTAPVTTGREEGARLPMTAPVTQARERDGWRVRFFLPDSYTLATAPQPTDAAIDLVRVPAARTVSLRFSGAPSEADLEARRAELRAWVRENGLTPVGEPVFAQYNSPFILPFLRRNEFLWRLAG